jgi:hypothetical protein
MAEPAERTRLTETGMNQNGQLNNWRMGGWEHG